MEKLFKAICGSFPFFVVALSAIETVGQLLAGSLIGALAFGAISYGFARLIYNNE